MFKRMFYLRDFIKFVLYFYTFSSLFCLSIVYAGGHRQASASLPTECNFKCEDDRLLLQQQAGCSPEGDDLNSWRGSNESGEWHKVESNDLRLDLLTDKKKANLNGVSIKFLVSLPTTCYESPEIFIELKGVNKLNRNLRRDQSHELSQLESLSQLSALYGFKITLFTNKKEIYLCCTGEGHDSQSCQHTLLEVPSERESEDGVNLRSEHQPNISYRYQLPLDAEGAVKLCIVLPPEKNEVGQGLSVWDVIHQFMPDQSSADWVSQDLALVAPFPLHLMFGEALPEFIAAALKRVLPKEREEGIVGIVEFGLAATVLSGLVQKGDARPTSHSCYKMVRQNVKYDESILVKKPVPCPTTQPTTVTSPVTCYSGFRLKYDPVKLRFVGYVKKVVPCPATQPSTVTSPVTNVTSPVPSSPQATTVSSPSPVPYSPQATTVSFPSPVPYSKPTTDSETTVLTATAATLGGAEVGFGVGLGVALPVSAWLLKTAVVKICTGKGWWDSIKFPFCQSDKTQGNSDKVEVRMVKKGDLNNVEVRMVGKGDPNEAQGFTTF